MTRLLTTVILRRAALGLGLFGLLSLGSHVLPPAAGQLPVASASVLEQRTDADRLRGAAQERRRIVELDDAQEKLRRVVERRETRRSIERVCENATTVTANRLCRR